MIGISSLDLLAFPLRHTVRTIVTVIDAKRGELFYAFYRQVPGGVQRLGELQVGTPDELLADLLATHDEYVLRRRRRAPLPGPALPAQGRRVRRAVAGASVGRARSCSWPTPRALREDWVNPWELEPIYLRKPDAVINWATREHR